jgi:hypothetical protein
VALGSRWSCLVDLSASRFLFRHSIAWFDELEAVIYTPEFTQAPSPVTENSYWITFAGY